MIEHNNLLKRDIIEYKKNERYSVIYYLSGILIILITLLVIQFNVSGLFQFLIDVLIILILFIELKSSYNVRIQSINRREERLKELFNQPIDTCLYTNTLIHDFIHQHVEVVTINEKPHVKINNEYISIDIILLNHVLINDLSKISNQIINNHHAELSLLTLNRDVDKEKFSKFIDKTEYTVLSLSEKID